jgi:hypothetical protein
LSEQDVVAHTGASWVREIANFALAACKPLFWHDRSVRWPKDVHGGSCFVLRFGNTIIGVTAAHVVQQYEAARAQTLALVCQLGNIEFDLAAAMIDRDDDLDIATFSVTSDQLKRLNGFAFDCTGAWPPPTPDRTRAISLVGCPEQTRIIRSDLGADFAAYGALGAVDDINDRDILVTYDPSRDQMMVSAVPVPPLGFNMSGCSGGPAIIHGERAGLHRWYPVGMILRGPGSFTSGDAAAFDMIRVRRIHFVRTDGTIDPPSSGWLPPRPYIDPTV